MRSLAAAGRFAEALRITEASLSRPLSVAEQGEFRCGLASIYIMTGQPDRARTESEWVLGRADLADRAHREASTLLLRALAGLPDQQQAEDRARAVLTARAERDAGEVTTAVSVLAGLRWREGRVMDALRLYREAASGEWLAAAGTLRPLGAQLDLASRLIDIRELDEAKALVDAPVEDVSMVTVAESQTRPALLRARIHLAEGRLDLAAGQARAALSEAPDADDCSYSVVAKCLLGSIALRGGRQHECESWLEQVPADLAGPDAGPLGVARSMLAALAVEERDGPGAALQPIAWLYDQIGEFRWLLLSDPGVAPWLVRIALAAGDQQRAELANAGAAELGRMNGAFPAVAASGRHAAGLFSGQAEPLEDAVRTQPDVWARASAAEDLGVLLTTADHKGDAVARLEQAQDGYSQLGAVRDMARVRHRLRILGVVHRHWAAAQPGSADGLAGLTNTEAGIAELVARGLTNRQIADQTFVSTHTVAFHLRQIYRKLGVASRVELARLVLAAQRDAGSANGHHPAL
jgi:DNA-binding CsgD family transcriptional regulator